ncbi:hypothetical protein EON62_04240 [archaeon]|nr:MAG: hypothetical protein EON62_04240 [archaeon]
MHCNAGGYLSYLYPAMFDHKTEDLPWHPCLEVVSDAEDKLNMMLSRRVVSMRKVADYDYAKADEYRAAVAARAEERGLAGVGLKSRLANAYDSWYDVHKEELVTVPAASSALTSDAGAAGAAGAEAALTSDVKRYVLNADAVPELDSKRSQKQHRRRLLRQAKRLERVVAESERSASSAGAPDEEGEERATTPSA